MAEASPAEVVVKARPFSTRFLRSELMLIFGRRRNWAGLAVLAAIPLIIAIVTKIWPPGGGPGGGPGGEGGEGPSFFNDITSNGLFVALTALTAELPLFLPLAVAAIAGDAVAGEANQGTLRYLLAVPVHRTRLLLVKYAGVVIFAFAAALLVAAVGTVASRGLWVTLTAAATSCCCPAPRSVSARGCCGCSGCAPTSRSACRRSARSGCSCRRSPNSRSAPRSPR
ncbi:hypothetical protein GCM10009558_041600 [Virgisporangium aurantiacum]